MMSTQHTNTTAPDKLQSLSPEQIADRLQRSEIPEEDILVLYAFHCENDELRQLFTPYMDRHLAHM